MKRTHAQGKFMAMGMVIEGKVEGRKQEEDQDR